MYTSEIDKHEFAIKPMNCPGGILVYKNDIHSYKEFPIKSGELGVVHRHEASGALHGLFRVRVFTQDDAHVFCREDQIEQEVIKLIQLYDEIYSKFGLKFHIELSTMPENAIGTKEIWDLSEKALAKACEVGGYDYVINEGDGAFYGPKLDFKLHDSIGRTWQCGTIQLDWNLPERFDMTYIAEDGSKKRPAMIHRALLGSLERFLGILTEHYAGAFPTWMAPEQVRIIPVNLELHGERAKEINEILFDGKVRSSVDDRDEKMNKKIRESQINKVRYSIIIGDDELANGTVTVRAYGSQENATMSLDEFKTNILEEISTRR
jgi:threonyl-tRNA synthetase